MTTLLNHRNIKALLGEAETAGNPAEKPLILEKLETNDKGPTISWQVTKQLETEKTQKHFLSRDFLPYQAQPKLHFSGELPCINVGKPKRPNYIPLEALSTLQRTSLVEKSRQKSQERMAVLSDVLASNKYDADALLQAAGVSIDSSFTQIQGRVLSAPKLKVGNGEDFFPRNGWWNYNHKLWRDLARCGKKKGIYVEDPFMVLEENPQARRASPHMRVEKMFEQIKAKLPTAPRFLLCLLPERKTSTIYGLWKRKNLADFGIFTQCIAPMRVNDQYLTNVLLKINAKLGGLNSLLSVEQSPSMPMISKSLTIILGMDVSHGSPGQSDIPSIVAVVSSRQWPLISHYRASVRTQFPKVEMIDSLFKPVSATVDEGIVRELLLDFYANSGKVKPDQIIIFRDGVSESQFNQVLNIELDQIIEACKSLSILCPTCAYIPSTCNIILLLIADTSAAPLPYPMLPQFVMLIWQPHRWGSS